MLIDFYCICCSFLLNGKWVLNRTNVQMVCCIFVLTFLNILVWNFFLGYDINFYLCHFVNQDPGPQVPTNVTGMLKFGTNLLQVVGQFNGKHLKLLFFPIILIAINICISYCIVTIIIVKVVMLYLLSIWVLHLCLRIQFFKIIFSLLLHLLIQV